MTTKRKPFTRAELRDWIKRSAADFQYLSREELAHLKTMLELAYVMGQSDGFAEVLKPHEK